MIRLNVGSGEKRLEGYINIEPFYKGPQVDVRADARWLPFKTNSVDEVLSCHVIEHLDFHQGYALLLETYRVLKPGGVFVIELPDLTAACKTFVEGDGNTRLMMLILIYGEPWIPGHAHYFGYSKEHLIWRLQGAGFVDIIEHPALSLNVGGPQGRACMKFVMKKPR